ncbi:TonB-dependent receptor [Gilvimarinus japonicus]|uniref:TonB-dependent receptor n=1 Tax=Gilvimarinus japonicus TaxID=1796469 RepID=A0ABV7HLI6_9GAMM
MNTRRKALLASAIAAIISGTTSAQDAPASNNEMLEEVVVVGIRSSLEKAQDIKRSSDNVVDAIVADDIGKFPDDTVAAALQRVPGIQVVNGFNNEIGSPLIRGIGDIVTTLDGRKIFTGVGRGFSFQDLPAETLSGVDVYKSNSAELVEGGIAGVINLKRVKPFGFDEGWTVATNVRARQGEEVDKTNLTGGILVSNRFDTSVGEMGLLVDVSYSDQDFSRGTSFNCDPRSGTNGPEGGAGAVLPTCVGGLSDTGDYQRPQANVYYQWRPSENLEVYADALYAGYETKFGTYFVFSDIFAAQSITDLAMTGDSFTAPVNGAGFYDASSTTMQELRLGQSATFNNVPGLSSTQAKSSETDQYVYGGGVKYTTDKLDLAVDLSRVESENGNRSTIVDIGKQIDSVSILVNDGSHGTTMMPGNPLGDKVDFRFANGLVQDYNRSESEANAISVDGAFKLSNGFIRELQFGTRYSDRDAQFFATPSGGPGAPGGNRVTLISESDLPDDFLVKTPGTISVINDGAKWYTPSADFLRDNTDQLRELYGADLGDPDWDPSKNYQASEKNSSVYLQAKYEVDLASGMLLDGLIGGRYSHTSRSLSGTGRVNGELTPVTRDTSDGHFLPNASARLQLTEELQMRLTYAKTIAQPFFGDLNPGLTYDVPLNANVRPGGAGGNPDLKPQTSDAYDATVEYYFDNSSYISAALYYRTIEDRVAVGTDVEVIDGIEYNISKPRNLGQSSLQGVELSSQWFLDFLPEGWDGLGVTANYTLADSSIDTEGDPLEGEPLLGVSKHSYNVGLLYEKYGVTARVVYNWRSEYDDGYFGGGLVTPGDGAKFNTVKANGRLDFSIGYDVTENVTVSFDGINVNGGKYYSYFDTESFPHDIRLDDTFYGASVRANF